MTPTPSRRAFVTGLAGAAMTSAVHDTASSAEAHVGAELGSPEDFSFPGLREKARRLAAKPFVPASPPSPEIIAKIGFDEYQRICFRQDRTFFLGWSDQYPVQLFHLGRYAKEPVDISIVGSDGRAREIVYRSDLFDIPSGHPALDLPVGIGFAGFRIMGSDLKRDWFSALGASYFRSSGPFDQYGLSARAIAIDTAIEKPEEFPRFVHFWLLSPAASGQPLEIYALLDGPSLTGALRIAASRTTDDRGVHRVLNDIEAHFFVRADIERVGLAPLSSMYWYGEAPHKQPSDWRPEIHDSDGLAVWTGAGERLWRPLLNPPRLMTNFFVDKDVKGFGLVQRDRDFYHYLDDGAFYDRRPSVWIEPKEKWGEGSVQLIEMPTGEETWDNVVAYWAPKEPWKAGENKGCKYRLSWLDAIDYPQDLARVVGTWSGFGGPPGLSYKDRNPSTRKFVIDFESTQFAGLGRRDGVELVVNTSRGTIADAASYPVVSQQHRWRGMFDLTADGDDPVDLRAYLRRGDSALSETWIYQHFPDAYF
jgi:glucans biosynthesis protein